MAVLRPWDDRPSESTSDSADAAAADLAKRRADVTAQEHPGPSADAARLEAYKAAPDVALGETLDSRPRAVPSPNVALGETLDSDPSHPSQRPAASRVSLGSSAFPVENWARYEFIKLLGQGGMGAVYQAKDKQLGRIVALKFIRGGDPNLVMRFVQEARAQSRIEHPGICKVYEVGEVEGKAYIAMQYVPGQPLGEAAVSMTQTEKVQVMSRVARALSAAHQLGIIHRDIKPQNIMVEQTPNGWLPVVMDFGLAREAGEGKGLTESGAVLGTPAYMSPEQARGDVRHLDHRTDVYSLGATLYDLLAGVPPFDAESVVDLLMAVLDNEPIPLRTRIPSLPVALETIVGRCLVKEREQRYPSAIALADDLDRFLLGEEIRARRIGLYLRGSRWVRKHKALSAVSLLSVIAVLFLIGAGVVQRIAARRDAQQAMRRAALERELAQQLKEITWILRVAYQLPAHDVRFEQAMVRARLQELTRRGAGLGRVGEGLVAYAGAEGHLALHEYKAAYEKLQQAQAAGIDAPELHHALGRTLGALFEQGMADARRSGDKSWQEKRRVELSAQYLQPALRSLEKSRSLELESPEYLDGLIAYYQQKYDEAQSKGRRAAALLPWLYEAEQLEGNALFERALALKNSGEYDESRKLLQDSLRHYQAAAEIGRSDEQVYDALCTAWQLHAELDRTQGRPQEDAMQRSIKACDLMITTAPYHSTGYTKKARAYFFLAWPMLDKGGDVNALIKTVLLLAEKAIFVNQNDAYAYDLRGNAYGCLARYEALRDGSPIENLKWARIALEKAIVLNGNFPWAYNDLAIVSKMHGIWKLRHGVFAFDELYRAIGYLDKAISLDGNFQSAYSGSINIYATLIEEKSDRGMDFQGDFLRSEKIAMTLLNINHNSKGCFLNRAKQRMLFAEFLRLDDKDPLSMIKLGLDDIFRLENIGKADGNLLYLKSTIYRISAMYELNKGLSAFDSISKGKVAADKCLEIKPDLIGCIREAGLLRFIEAKFYISVEKSGMLLIRNAMGILSKGIRIDAADAEVRNMMAEILMFMVEKKIDLPKDKCLELANGYLADSVRIDPKFAKTHALIADLRLLEYFNGRTSAEKSSLLTEARSRYLHSFQLNPMLRRQYGAQLERVEKLLGGVNPRLKN